VSSIFLIFLDTQLGSVLCFVVLAIFAALAWVFVYFLVPETANRTIDDILIAILGEGYKSKEWKGDQIPQENITREE
jgi:hypothetical protein